MRAVEGIWHVYLSLQPSSLAKVVMILLRETVVIFEILQLLQALPQAWPLGVG